MNIIFDEASKDDIKELVRLGFVDKEHRYTDMRYKY